MNNSIERDAKYDSLESVLNEAYEQAAFGKGCERHGNADKFEDQVTGWIEAQGLSFCEGQATKKIIEAHRTGSEADLLGAINYIAARVIANRRKNQNSSKTSDHEST